MRAASLSSAANLPWSSRPNDANSIAEAITEHGGRPLAVQPSLYAGLNNYF
jgi:hypothetical protein